MKKRMTKLLSMFTSGAIMLSQLGVGISAYAAPEDDADFGDILEERFEEEAVIEEDDADSNESAEETIEEVDELDEEVVFGVDQVETEKNDSLATATRINTGSTVQGKLSSSNDKDWYKFTLSDAGYISVDFSHDYIDNHNQYWALNIYTSDEKRLTGGFEYYGDESGESRTSNVGLPAGTYYVRVYDPTYSNEDVSYYFKVNYTKSSTWEQEFNDSLTAAQRIPLNTDISGAINRQSSPDWYKFTVEKDSVISVNFSHELVDSHTDFWSIRVCDENEKKITDVVYSYGDEKSTAINNLSLKAGTYYIRVYPNYFSNVDYTLRISDGSSQAPSTPTPSTPTPSTPTPGTPDPGFVDGPAPRLKYDSTGTLRCYVNQVRDDSYTGLALYYSGGRDYFVYVRNGKRDESYSGYVAYNGGVFYVAGGTLADYLNGLVQDPNYPRDWYYLANGQKQAQYTGLAYYDGEWFYVTEGWLNTEYTAYTEYDGGLFYVAAGRIASEVSGLAKDPNGIDWYYLANGQAQTQYTGLAYYDGAWFYVKNGRLAQEYTGTVSYNGSAFYVVNGMLR